ncbi:adenosylmethionine--8-amino-7-oxononanoate transaminase [Bosea sp. RAF48]|uniref:adenosylmethionine--8-amino-7-oxononanoate transaminase n=1 Tax=Bosea sp. RAF48 TaxID=3237480 RepID=UPI003F92F766
MSSGRASPIWHPFTQHALQPVMTEVASAEGAHLTTADGRRILDAISSWWVITHGHRHPRIVQAIKDQADRLDQIIFAGHTHAPAERLAEKLVALVPGLDHVFYSDSGSTSVEVALKMALGYWRNIGAPRSRIVVMEGSYHGDTIGTMSVGARGVFNAAYELFLFNVARIPFPTSGREEATLDALGAACREGSAAALIVEPLVLGAGGMLMYGADVLSAMRRICEAHGVLFIAGEVMTGWGRTGTLFAYEQAGVVPDIACYSKGLTGGSLPLAVTMCRRKIFEAHYSTDRGRTFFHSSSYTANPIACAAACANLEIWSEEPVADRVAGLARMQEAALECFRDDHRFENIRRAGTITALDLRADDPGYLAGIGPRLQAFFRERDLLLRPLGNTIYVLPPYCVTQGDLDLVYAAIGEAADTFGAAA